MEPSELAAIFLTSWAGAWTCTVSAAAVTTWPLTAIIGVPAVPAAMLALFFWAIVFGSYRRRHTATGPEHPAEP